MKEYKVDDHVTSFLPENKNWKLVWSDEFDGDSRDESKWGFREYFWGKKSPTFTREGVYVDGKSNLHIAMVKKGDDYFSAQLQTGAIVYMICLTNQRAFGRSENRKSLSLCINSVTMSVGAGCRKTTVGTPHSGFRHRG